MVWMRANYLVADYYDDTYPPIQITVWIKVYTTGKFFLDRSYPFWPELFHVWVVAWIHPEIFFVPMKRIVDGKYQVYHLQE